MFHLLMEQFGREDPGSQEESNAMNTEVAGETHGAEDLGSMDKPVME